MANDPLAHDVEFTCSACGLLHKMSVDLSCNLKIGDAPYRDPRRPEFGKCKRCKKRTLVASKVPVTTSPVKLPGFWAPPTAGNLSGMATGSSEEPKE